MTYRIETLKNYTLSGAHSYISHIWEYPPPSPGRVMDTNLPIQLNPPVL